MLREADVQVVVVGQNATSVDEPDLRVQVSMVQHLESLTANQGVVGVDDHHNILGVAVLSDEEAVVGERADVLGGVDELHAVVDARFNSLQVVEHSLDILGWRVVVNVHQVEVRVVLPRQTLEQLDEPAGGVHLVPCSMDANGSLSLVLTYVVLFVHEMVLCFLQFLAVGTLYEQTAEVELEIVVVDVQVQALVLLFVAFSVLSELLQLDKAWIFL